jgi:hypothetical protein
MNKNKKNKWDEEEKIEKDPLKKLNIAQTKRLEKIFLQSEINDYE